MAREWMSKGAEPYGIRKHSRTQRLCAALQTRSWDPELHRRKPITRKRVTGDVRDGHHRLAAIMLTGIPAECYVKELSR